MNKYFDEFKNKMKSRMRILKLVVDHYFDNIYSMVDTNFTYVHEVLPRVAWLRPMQYEVNVDEVNAIVTALLFEEINKNSKPFNNYESAKNTMLMQTKVLKMDRK